MLVSFRSIAYVILISTFNQGCMAWAPPVSNAQSSQIRTTDTALKMSATEGNDGVLNRRNLLQSATAAIIGMEGVLLNSQNAFAADTPDGVNIDNFLKTGMVSQPMGVSGQAGKSRPETGVVLREGSSVARDSRTGNVVAEILVGDRSDPIAVFTSFDSPWPLAVGTVFDVESRDAKTGDGAFLAVTESTGGKALADLPKSFFLAELVKPTGRFSFYGAPTDVKVKKDSIEKDYRYIELTFSTLSQSTQTEIPRNAIIATTIVPGTENAVMLVGSATSNRWKKGAGDAVRSTVESFRAVPAPKSGLKVRAKQRGDQA